MHTKNNPLPGWVKAVFGLMIVLLLVGGVWFYRVQRQTMMKMAEQELTSIAHLKVDQIVAWRKNQLQGAALFASYSFVTERVAAFFTDPRGKAARELLVFLELVLREDEYADILLADADGQVRLSLSGNVRLLPDYASLLNEALARGRPVFTALHTNPERPAPHISVIAPLYAGGGQDQRHLGGLILVSNTSDFLYPLIQFWPTASKSAETLLVTRDGDSALLLNDLRRQPGTALRQRIPLSRTDVPAVMAVLGTQGVVQGVDCLGVEVLAVIMPVPDSPWFMVAKVDAAEVFAAWRFRSVLILALLSTFSALLMTASLVAWQRSQKIYYRELYRAEAALRASAEEYQSLSEDLPAMVCTFLPDSTLTYVNRAYADYFQRSPEDLIGKRFLDFLPEDAAYSVRDTFMSLTPERPTQTYCHQVIRNGQEAWQEWTDRAFFNEKGVVFKFQAVGFDVTERKKAEEALRESEDRYRDLVESSYDLICTHDLEGRILSVNPRPAQLLGYGQEELIGMNLRDLLVPEVRRRFDQYLDEVKSQGAADGVMQVQTRHGERRMWEYHNSLRSDGMRGPVVRGMAHDVTERNQAEDAMRKSEALFKKLFENHSAIKFIIDPDTGCMVDANAAAANFYGWSRDQFRQMRVQDINTLSSEEIEQQIEKVRTGRQNYFQFQHRRADGSIRDVEVFSSKIELEGKDLLHSIVHDITERKQVEAERERLMAAIEQAGETVVITDAAGAIQYVNPAFERVTGYSPEEAVGNNPRILNSGRQDEAFYRELWQTISSGQNWHGRMVNKRKDGEFFTEDATISPVMDASGRIVNYVGVKHDVTEHLRLADQFQQSQKMESVGRLAGGVAHDYNNMLGVIIGYAELALAKIEPGASLRHDLEQILHAANRSTDLTRQLLAFARKQTIAPRLLDLNETVESMLKMLRRLIGEDIDLAWLPATNLGKVKMDPAQVDQILANLCVNARDAIAGVGKVTIETQNVTIDEAYCSKRLGFTPGDYVLLAVSDDGCGMDKNTLENIFEPFFTTKGVGEGTGLGLATVYGIVRQNNGFINVYSESGGGSSFKIYLPRHAGKAEAPIREGAVETPRGNGETVLLVEDEPVMLKMGQLMLEKLDYRVLAARTPGEVLRLAKEHSKGIDLLLTDVIMPEMNGRELAHLLKSLHPHLKVLFMSGYTANAIAHRGELNAGVNFIQKPFSMNELAVKVRLALTQDAEPDA